MLLLSGMPTEILTQIFSNLDPHHTQSFRTGPALVCSTFYNVSNDAKLQRYVEFAASKSVQRFDHFCEFLLETKSVFKEAEEEEEMPAMFSRATPSRSVVEKLSNLRELFTAATTQAESKSVVQGQSSIKKHCRAEHVRRLVLYFGYYWVDQQCLKELISSEKFQQLHTLTLKCTRLNDVTAADLPKTLSHLHLMCAVGSGESFFQRLSDPQVLPLLTCVRLDNRHFRYLSARSTRLLSLSLWCDDDDVTHMLELLSNAGSLEHICLWLNTTVAESTARICKIINKSCVSLKTLNLYARNYLPVSAQKALFEKTQAAQKHSAMDSIEQLWINLREIDNIPVLVGYMSDMSNLKILNIRLDNSKTYDSDLQEHLPMIKVNIRSSRFSYTTHGENLYGEDGLK